jgi:hypothetical protein
MMHSTNITGCPLFVFGIHTEHVGLQKKNKFGYTWDAHFMGLEIQFDTEMTILGKHSISTTAAD